MKKKLGSRNKRIFGLDVLRAIAIMMVVFEHGRSLLPPNWRSIQDVFNFDGVTIFFVLSGFLIGGILIRAGEREKNNFDILHFWKRRWFRTLPNYFLVLFLLLLLDYMWGNPESIDYKHYFFFFQNLLRPHPSFFPEAWSLSIEEWFYFLFPVVYLLFLKSKVSSKKSILITCFSFIIFSITFRLYEFFDLNLDSAIDWDLHLRKVVLTRLDSVALGVFGAVVSFYYKSLWVKYKKPLFAIGVGLFIFSKMLFFQSLFPLNYLLLATLRLSFDSLATLFLLPLLSTIKEGRNVLVSEFITFISIISYSLYLLHLTFVKTWIIGSIDWVFFLNNRSLAMAISYLLYWGLSLSLSYILFKYFEKPMTSLRDINLVNYKFKIIAKKIGTPG